MAVLVLRENEGSPTEVAAGVLVAEDVVGASFGWSDLMFSTPITCEIGGVYLAFRVPSGGATVSDGIGGGAGIGYARGAGARCWITVDGRSWVSVDRSFGLAVEPVFAASASGAAAKSSSTQRSSGNALDGDVRVETELLSISPNPFNPDTEIQFTLRDATRVAISIIDIGGHRIATLLDGACGPGLHVIRWDGRDDGGRGAASGVYFVHMTAGEFVASRRVLLVK